ncbi:homeobox protein Hox-D13a [Anguilla anguilla]|uniref:homeobox protein Hox-D13a n=1 Tax=Anguilla anguilla TaxID=7936 RepID=UPI0015A97072|nr:homeobox protein Hox-D13a [Anguilla anguilla]
MENLGGDIASVQNRSFYPSAFGAQSSRSASGSVVYSITDRTASLSPESIKTYALIPGSPATANPPIGFGCHFGNSYYGCKIPHGAPLQHAATKQTTLASLCGHSVDKRMDISGFGSSNVHCNEIPGRAAEFGVYQGYSGSYSRIPGYIDVPVVPRAAAGYHRHEAVLPIDGYQPWNWSNSWNSQLYCPKEQTPSPHSWKYSLAGETGLKETHVSTLYRRGRKKRVPYAKPQLKELEREYTTNKFITKDKRRKIASSTNLSERQVTIWFQNRRVKDKKMISKLKDVQTYC